MAQNRSCLLGHTQKFSAQEDKNNGECLFCSKNCNRHRNQKKAPNGQKKLGRTSLLTERPKGRKTPILLETDYRAT